MMKKLLVLSLATGMAVAGITWSAQAVPGRIVATQATASSPVTKVVYSCKNPAWHYDRNVRRCVP
jgi:hypothetical protein